MLHLACPRLAHYLWQALCDDHAAHYDPFIHFAALVLSLAISSIISGSTNEGFASASPSNYYVASPLHILLLFSLRKKSCQDSE